MLPSDESLKEKQVTKDSTKEQQVTKDSTGISSGYITNESDPIIGGPNYGAQGQFHGPVTVGTSYRNQDDNISISVSWKYVTLILRIITVSVALISGLLEISRILRPLMRLILGGS